MTKTASSGLVFTKNLENLEFVGKFEELYQTIKDPWHQSGMKGEIGEYYKYSRRRLVGAVALHSKDYDNLVGLEVGCGHGHVIDYLEKVTFPSSWEGIDISPTAINQARKLYPSGSFYVNDITKPGTSVVEMTLRYDVIILGQLLWYVMDKMDHVINNCHDFLAKDGLLIISQAFLRKQLYGKQIIDGFAGLITRMTTCYNDKFQVIGAQYDDSEKYLHHDGTLVLRKVEA